MTLTAAEQIRAVQIAENESNPMWMRDLAADYAEALKKLDALEAEHADTDRRIAELEGQLVLERLDAVRPERADRVWLTRDEAKMVQRAFHGDDTANWSRVCALLDERIGDK